MQNKQEKVALSFDIPKELDEQWRMYIAKKYNGYHRGSYTKEIEAALRYFMEHSSRIED